MKNTYFDLIDQSYYFPQDGFDLKDGYLSFHGISLKYLIDKYGTPFKGIRSMDYSEKAHMDLSKVYFAEKISFDNAWVDDSLKQMTNNIYSIKAEPKIYWKSKTFGQSPSITKT
jgi:hypothetical protein